MQYWGSSRPLHRDQWYAWLLDRVAALKLPVTLSLFIAAVPPALLLAWFLSVSQAWLFGLLGLALNVVLLLYCLGRRDYEGLAERYREQCREGDFEAAFLLAREEFPPGPGEELPENEEHLHRWMKRSLAYMAFERWFAVIFYFVLLGAPGALLYRLLHLSSLTGDYMGSREQLTSSIQNVQVSAAETISDAAHAALGLKSTVFSDNGDVEAFAQVSDWEIGQLQGLLSRSAVAWVLVISLLVLLL
jgi:AmpE protein